VKVSSKEKIMEEYKMSSENITNKMKEKYDKKVFKEHS
jgi:hypothetical protein